MKKHVLFLLGTEYSANGVCTYKVIDELKIRGYKVSVICYGDKYSIDPYTDRPNIHTIPLSTFFKEQRKNLLRKYAGKLRTLLFLPIYPIIQPLSVRHYIGMTEKLMKMDRIDTVIAVMRPVETAMAACALKKHHPEITTAIYELDSITNNVDGLVGWTKYVHFLVKNREIKLYKGNDYVIQMRCNEKYYSQKKYASFADKFIPTDIPLMTENQEQTLMPSNTDTENEAMASILYAGYLIRAYRSPYYLIELVKKASEKIQIRCDFYSRGNCEEYIKKCEQETDGAVRSNGYVSQKELHRAMEKTDFFANISLSYASEISSIPSKIFMYMAAGKPIIHIYNSDNDICRPYFNQYPAVLMIDQRDELEKNVKKLTNFLRDFKGKRLSFNHIVGNFEENTPAFTARIITAVIEKESFIKGGIGRHEYTCCRSKRIRGQKFSQLTKKHCGG